MEKRYDAIVILGRSIGKEPRGIKRSDGQYVEPIWRPAPYFGGMKEVDGRFIPLPHSGIFDNKIDPNSRGVMVAGANACVLAAAHLFMEQVGPPAVIIFAAGKPPYLLEKAPGLSEGDVLRRQFLHRLSLHDVPTPETVILADNRSTVDDMMNSTRVVQERNLKYVAFVTVEVHKRRSREFLNRRVPEELREGLEIDFIAAEKILAGVDPRFERAFKSARKTPASRRTSFYEGRGARALIAGNY